MERDGEGWTEMVMLQMMMTMMASGQGLGSLLNGGLPSREAKAGGHVIESRSEWFPSARRSGSVLLASRPLHRRTDIPWKMALRDRQQCHFEPNGKKRCSALLKGGGRELQAKETAHHCTKYFDGCRLH